MRLVENDTVLSYKRIEYSQRVILYETENVRRIKCMDTIYGESFNIHKQNNRNFVAKMHFS